MTDEPEEKPHIPPLKGYDTEPEKHGFRIGVFTFWILVLLFIVIFITTPLFSFIVSYIPATYQQSLFENVYKSVTLAEDSMQLKEPKKYAPKEPLPVLGFDTGLCFSFQSTIKAENKAFITASRLERAKKGKGIAEIIVIGDNEHEYKLKAVSLEEILDKDDTIVSTVCQKFGNTYALLPKTVKAVFVRPYKPFAPKKIVWASARDVYSE